MANKKYKPTGKTHVLSTLEDMANVVTVENFPYLMQDIAMSFAYLAELKKGGLDLGIINFKSVKWTDDGKSELTAITFTPIKKKTATKRKG